MDISSLEARYLNSCRKHEVVPNSAVLSWFTQAKTQKPCQGKSCIAVLLNQQMGADISPLIDLILAIESIDIDAVDILYESPCNLTKEHVMSLLRAVNVKLRVLDLHDTSMEEGILRDLCHQGLTCQVLNVRSTCIQKLNMVGSFMQLHTLNLDFCTSITSFHKDCFSCMPNLTCLSMCGTRVANLWITSAALLKLPSLRELRFQNCLCCKDTGPCPASFGDKENIRKHGSAQSDTCSSGEAPSVISGDVTFRASHASQACGNLLSLTDSVMNKKINGRTAKLSDVNGIEISSCIHAIDLLEISLTPTPNLKAQARMRCEDKDDFYSASVPTSDLMNSANSWKDYSSHHPSSICYEKHYREYMIASLPHLKVLDNLLITEMEKEVAKSIFSKYYEWLPYKRQCKESVVSILHNREMGTSGIFFPNFFKPNKPYPYGNSQRLFQRSLSAAKLGSAAWPLLQPLCGHIHNEGRKRLRPRQFEYHPSDSSIMAFGTLDGEIVVINHENGRVVGYVPSTGAMNCVLGLCWLKKYPSKLLTGSDNGCLKLYDINNVPPKGTDASCSAGVVTFGDFELLSSVHVNSTDNQFLASGYSKDVALYDINSGARINLFSNMHREAINVAKFSHTSPFIFATSSFDRDVKLWDLRQPPERPCYTASSSRGNVMVCFSPDDLYLLVSAVDNEVKQLLAADGRLHMDFEIASTGSAHNYTRSYYMNGRDYVISGSCDEHVVHVCCAQTGRRLRDIYLEDIESGNSMFVQSLRGDPFWLFHMSVLTATKLPRSKWEIIKVNLLSSSHLDKEYPFDKHIHSYSSLGG